MMSFPVSMTCDDVCLWLKQNDTLEKDVETFGGTPVLISCMPFEIDMKVHMYCMQHACIIIIMLQYYI